MAQLERPSPTTCSFLSDVVHNDQHAPAAPHDPRASPSSPLVCLSARCLDYLCLCRFHSFSFFRFFSAAMGVQFGSFDSICQTAALVICPLVGPDRGIEPSCYSRNVEISGTLIFQPCKLRGSGSSDKV